MSTATRKRKSIRREDPELLLLREGVLRQLIPLIHQRGLDWEGARRQNEVGFLVPRGGEVLQVRLEEDVLRTAYDSAAAMAAALPARVPGAKGSDLAAATSRSPASTLARPAPTAGRTSDILRHYAHRVETVRAGDIQTRPGYQRLLSDRWAAELARDFNEYLLRPIMVSRRADGTLWCIDGQHRLRAICFYLGREDAMIEADIYENLTYDDETILCESFVHAKPQGVLDYLRLKFERNDQDALNLVAAVRAAGLDVAFDRAGKGKIASAGALVAVYEAAGQAHLSEVLALLTDMFGDHSRVYIQPHILGVHGFLVRYGEHQAYSRAELVRKIEAQGLGAVQQKAAVLAPTISGGNRATAFGKALQVLYNANRRSNFLPEWQEGVLTAKQRERREEVARVLGKKYGFKPAGRPNGRKVGMDPLEEDHS